MCAHTCCWSKNKDYLHDKSRSKTAKQMTQVQTEKVWCGVGTATRFWLSQAVTKR